MHNPDVLFTYCFDRRKMSPEDLTSIEGHIETCDDCQKELLLIFGTPWLIPPLKRLERKKLATSNSFYDRFCANFQMVIPGSNRPNGLVYWDIGGLMTMKQLLIVGQATFDLALGVVISGGTPELLTNFKSVLQSSLSADGPKMDYKWHLAKKKAVQYADIATEEQERGAWPQIGDHQCHKFCLRSVMDGFLLSASRHNIVVFLPEDRDELEEHWEYYFGSWVMMVWEEREGERQALIDRLLSIKEEECTRSLCRPYDEKYFPWLFKIDPRGNIQMITPAICRDIRPLPSLVRWRAFR